MAARNGNILRANDIVDRRYRVNRLCGKGGTAEVYHSTQLSTRAPCALKVQNPELANDPLARRLFALEPLVHARMGRNPHIVHVYESGLDSKRGHQYLVMEYVDGDTLEDYLKHWGPIPSDLALVLLEQFADGMGQAHAAGVVHRDLKLTNLFLTFTYKGEPILKISDFGVAKVLEGCRANVDTPVGTPAYAAPEQRLYPLRWSNPNEEKALGASITCATDVWAFGLITLELLTAIRANDLWFALVPPSEPISVDAQVTVPTRCTISQVCTRSNQLPLGFDAWLQKCLEVDPADRFQTTELAFRELQRLFYHDQRFSGMVIRDEASPVRYIIVRPVDKRPWRKPRVRTQKLPPLDGMDTTTQQWAGAENGNTDAASNASHGMLSKRPYLLACAAVAIAAISALIARLPAQETAKLVPPDSMFMTNISTWNPVRFPLGANQKRSTGTEDTEIFTLEPNAELDFHAPSYCRLDLGGYLIPFAPPFAHVRFHAKDNISVAISCADKEIRLGRCWLNIAAGDQKTLTISSPDDLPNLPNDCSKWLK